jgi:hypothetical protein
MKNWFMIGLLCIGALTQSGAAQQKVYDWVIDNGELVRMNPGWRQQTHVYNCASAGSIKVGIKSQQPVTVAVVQRRDWENSTQSPGAIYRDDVMKLLPYRCVQEHVTNSIYTCDLPASDDPMLLIVHDERPLDHQQGNAVVSEIGNALHMPQVGRVAQLDEIGKGNEVHLEYYRWSCVQNCIAPSFRSVRLSKEKYPLTNVAKLYSLPLPEYDGEQVELKLKSSVPMLVAVVPTATAAQIYRNPDMLDSVIAGGICQERGVQSMNFACKLSANAGAQSLLVSPEPAAALPSKSKAEIELTSVKCIAHCQPVQ